MNILCTICMRGNSKGVSNKNIKKINNKPLLFYTIDQAKKSKIFSDIVVSSDSSYILKLASKYKVDACFQRPIKLAKDASPKIPAIRHLFFESEKFFKKTYNMIVDLDVTSPLRTHLDIINSIKKIIKDKADNLVSVSPSRRNPYFNMLELKNNKVSLVKKPKKKVYRRQATPKVYDMNASIYIWRRKTLINSNDICNKKTSLFVMPQNRSLDIDSIFDSKLVEFIMKKKINILKKYD